MVTRNKVGEPPYWLVGEEQCPLCLQHYPHALERRCGACDEAVCAHCVVVLPRRHEVLCLRCHALHALKGA